MRSGTIQVSSSSSGLVLVLDGIADPGNAGSILRTARAAGVAGVVATQSTTDLWSPKAVRAGMSAHFHLNMIVDQTWPVDVGPRMLLLASAHQGEPYWAIDWSEPLALIIGSEAHGASSDATRQAAQRVTIPMAEGAESLNAAAAAAVLLFQWRRHFL